MAQYAALLGIDWSDKKHDLCLIETVTGKRESLVLPHSPQAIDEWATALRARLRASICLTGKDAYRPYLLTRELQRESILHTSRTGACRTC